MQNFGSPKIMNADLTIGHKLFYIQTVAKKVGLLGKCSSENEDSRGRSSPAYSQADNKSKNDDRFS